MALITVANQSKPATPSAGNTSLYTDTTAKELAFVADDGIAHIVRPLTNCNTGGDQSIAANTNTYVTGASLAIPPALLHAGATFRWVFAFSKTVGQTGTATPSWTVVFGTNGSIADTARLTFTGVAMTSGVADNALVQLDVVCRSVGASGVIEGVYWMTHLGAAATQQTGLANQPTDVKQATSSGFDTTVASSIIGVGVNFGANTAATIQHASVVGFNL